MNSQAQFTGPQVSSTSPSLAEQKAILGKDLWMKIQLTIKKKKREILFELNQGL